MVNVKIEKSWLNYLSNEFKSDYMMKLSIFLKEEKKQKLSTQMEGKYLMLLI